MPACSELHARAALLATLPLDTCWLHVRFTAASAGTPLCLQATRIMRLARIMRLLKMVRMLRIFKLGVVIRRLETLMGRGMLRVVFFVCLATLILHITACFFYFIAMQHDNFENTWVQAAGGAQQAACLVPACLRFKRSLKLHTQHS
jgi:hypothetical protein